MDRDYYENVVLKTVPDFTQFRLEMTNACGCKCFMCPRNKMTRKIGVMSLKNLEVVLNKLKYVRHEIPLHLHGYGEALLCEDLPERVRLAKSVSSFFKPHITTTLAYEIERKWWESLLRSGLHDIVVSVYEYDVRNYESVHGSRNFGCVVRNLTYLSELKEKYDFRLVVKLDDFEGIFPDRVDIREHLSRRDGFVKFLLSIGYLKKEISSFKLHPFGNSSAIASRVSRGRGGICSLVFGSRRDILQVDWEGNVVPCCFDFNSAYVWGNLVTQSLEEVFSSDRRRAFLDKIVAGEYIPLCDGCPSR